MSSVAVPAIVTTIGNLFMDPGTIKIGGRNMNFEKNHPETIVPKDSRSRALFSL